MESMNSLADQLSRDLKPVKALPKPWLLTLCWLVGGGLALGGFIAIFHRYRGDAEMMLHSARFWWVWGGLLFFSALSSILALHSALPGRDLSKTLFSGLGLVFLLALVPLLIDGFVEPQAMAMSGLSFKNGWHCSFSLVMYSLLPAAALFFFVQKKLASTRPLITGVFLGLAVGAFGAATLAWTCSVNEVVHLLIWHLSPIFILSFIFAKLAGKFLSF